jgi:hypothetical protein
MSLMRLAKSRASEVKAVSHPISPEFGETDSRPLIAIHFSRLRSRVEAQSQAAGKTLITARNGTRVPKNKEPQICGSDSIHSSR